ncbi:MAG TPA: hypothetical protein VGJ70_02320 [Solirubrobacteraceae bacterium]
MDRRRQDRRVPALTLHVTNGDAVAPAIAAVTGRDVLPWRDVLHDGPVPAGLDADALAQAPASGAGPLAGRRAPARLGVGPRAR